MPYPAVFLSALVPAVGFIAVLQADAGDWSPPAAAAEPVDFVRDVQPIFANHCYSCHGPKRQESAFRLDLRADALKGGDGGAAISPGKAAESPLLQHVAGKDGYFMPPKGERLTGKQVGILRRWIDDGAVWPDEASGKRRDARNHWAFKAPQRPALPKVSNVGWGRMAIDRFILARLEKEGMAPSPEADRITLIRRLSLDLVGLPPTTAEVDAFVADRRPDAYARAVEKLLASPHYGERWARHWLDAARYADSDGYEKDKSRQVWFYRDWVVGALNRDLPYDRFIVEQIAGDLIPGATQDQIVATGFLRNSMINEEGGVDPEQFRMDAMFDRMECIGKSVLGLTIQCAQCHAHKFDPIAHEEYYRLFAYLNNDHEAQRVVYTAEERRKIADLRRAMAAIENDLRMRTPDWAQRMAAWEKALPKSPDWKLLKLENAGDNGQRYLPQEDGSILCAGYAPTKTHTHFHGPSPIETIGAFRVELLNDPNLPCNGPGRSFMGTCALSEFTVEATSVKDPKKKVNVKFKRATADYGNPVRGLEVNFDDKSKKKRVTGPVDYAIDGKEDTAWGIDQGPGRRNAPHEAVFIPENPVGFPGGTILDVHVKQLHGGWNSDDHMNNNLGRFRLSAADGTLPKADP
ncbi:MAG TPA: DUF1549 domain-containing protein, partial [Planctomycetia bacterium]|nr:DUF1549 domain-containing protein [Planctomycetia bacterium]